MIMMRIKKHIYLGLSLCIAMLSGCSDDEAPSKTLSGDGTKTPLSVTALLDASSPALQTRASNMVFEEHDNLLAYVRHVTWNGPVAKGQPENPRTPVSADKAPVLITFTKGGADMVAYSGSDITPIGTGVRLDLTSANTKQTSDLTNDLGVGGGHIYWDDFSDASNAATDLHTANHYLQSYYGYCYNGGTPAEGLETGSNKENGIIKWTVQTDQTSGFKTSDLLWSAEQTPIAYNHGATPGDNTRAGLVLPYTHAMSKVTINVIAGDGFETDYDFATTGAQLDQVRTTCTATAPTATLTYPTDGTGKGDVTMMPGSVGTTNSLPSRSFSAIIVPSVLTVGNRFGTVTAMDGNNYYIPVTQTIIDGWSLQLSDVDEDINNGSAQAPSRLRNTLYADIPAGKGHQMKSGVHYILNVTVNKTEVTVSAVIRDWNEVTAEGEGVIHFSNDVTGAGYTEHTIEETLKAHGFDIYKSTTNTFGTKATTVRWNKASQVWRFNPVIYWQGGVSEYFRALWNAHTDTPGTEDVNESLQMENGRDVLWGTTKEHSGTDAEGQPFNYAKGAALPPRTGDVPLVFEHAMSKITFYLEDAAKGSSNDDSKLDLSRATIQLTDLATGGTIELYEGNITPAAITAGQKTFSEDNGAVPKRMGYYAAQENGVATSYNASLTLKDYYVIPQTITDNAMLIITLANGTTYRAKLNLCRAKNGVDGNGMDRYDYVTQWERGNHYVYTITLAKDTIEFRAEIKEWEEINASGTITPEW